MLVLGSPVTVVLVEVDKPKAWAAVAVANRQRIVHEMTVT